MVKAFGISVYFVATVHAVMGMITLALAFIFAKN